MGSLGQRESMNKGHLSKVRVVLKNLFQTLKSFFKLSKLKIYMREYQWDTVIQVWKKLSSKKQIWRRCIPYKLRTVDF